MPAERMKTSSDSHGRAEYNEKSTNQPTARASTRAVITADGAIAGACKVCLNRTDLVRHLEIDTHS